MFWVRNSKIFMDVVVWRKQLVVFYRKKCFKTKKCLNTVSGFLINASSHWKWLVLYQATWFRIKNCFSATCNIGTWQVSYQDILENIFAMFCFFPSWTICLVEFYLDDTPENVRGVGLKSLLQLCKYVLLNWK